MLKTISTVKGFSLSLSLIGLLGFVSAGALRAQDAPQNPSDNQPPAQQQQAPAPDPSMSNPPDTNSGQQNQSTPPATYQPPQYDQAAPTPQNYPDARTDSATDQGDPPSRAARVSVLEGSVSLQPGGQGDWGNAARNRPVTVGDKIWVDKGSRAEVQSGQATFHLGNLTAFSFLNLDGNTTQVRVAEGSINFRVREMREGDIYEVDTPNVAFTVKEAGAFRIDVAENGDGTRVTAIRGSGDVTAAGQTYTVHNGERAEFVGTDNSVQYVAHGAPPPDALDRWANDRDLRDDNSASAKYVNPDVPGVADLDDNGTWSEQPDVGPVWTPNNVGPDWAPYSDGAWNYVGPWGWSWVGYEPWGYAPYHYGRWGFYGSRWGWAPGPYWARPYYGPAFVGFLGGGGFGFGVGIGVGFGFGGGVGWFPLGWGEPFHPWYHAGAGYVRNINIHNTVIRNGNAINNRNFNYAYAHNTRAVTAASRSTFTSGSRVNRGATPVTQASLRGAQVSNGAGVSPTRSSYTGAGRGTASTPSSSLQNRGGNSQLSRSNQVASNRPPASLQNGARTGNTQTRTWSAQGNSTDHGIAPQGAGHSNIAGNSNASRPQTDRPQWARGNSTSSSSALGNRQSVAGGSQRTYTQQRAYSPPTRTNSAPRTLSGPSSAPRGGSAPRSTGGSAPRASGAPHGGGAPHGSGGAPHGGGGGSHGGGGGRH